MPISERRHETALPLTVEQLAAIQAAKYQHMRWKGAALLKDPFDFTLYCQLLAELRPRTVIEVGAYEGGSAVWMADMLGVLGVEAHLWAFDIDLSRIRISHPRVTFLRGDANDLDSLETASFGSWMLRTLPHPWLVIEDAHVNVRALLSYFDRHMTTGDYVVVEDLFDPAKHTEVVSFATACGYRVDTRYTDMFGYNTTWNLNGFLRKD